MSYGSGPDNLHFFILKVGINILSAKWLRQSGLIFRINNASKMSQLLKTMN